METAARLRYLDKMDDDKKQAAEEKAAERQAKKLAATARKQKLKDHNELVCTGV